MRLTTLSRRGLGLAASATLGVSTGVLGAPGVAFAAEGDGPVLADVTAAATQAFVVPADVCAVRFLVVGGAGDPAGFESGAAGLVTTTTVVDAGDPFTLTAGDASTGTGVAGQQSSVTGPAGFSITAAGGSGSGTARPANVVSPAAASVEADNAEDTSTTGTDFAEGPGVVLAVGVPCPEVPASFSASGGPQQAQLVISEQVRDPEEPLDDDLTYEVSIDGGPWNPLPVVPTDPTVRQVTGTVTGLTNGTAYAFRVRAVSSIGVGEPTAPSTATPFQPIGAPQGVVVTTGPSTVTVSWNGQVAAGTFPLAGWSVGYSGGESGDEACRLAPTVTTCTFAARAGVDYQVTVSALDTGNNSGLSATLRTGVVPATTAPTAVPSKDDGDITGPAGPISALVAGQKVTLQGSGFAANSAVQLTVFSSPISLGTVATDADGAFSVEVTVPANLANGTHHLVATGLDPAGNVRNLVITVTISGGVATLATTGFDAVPVAVGGALVLLVGGGLLVGARRRTTV